MATSPRFPVPFVAQFDFATSNDFLRRLLSLHLSEVEGSPACARLEPEAAGAEQVYRLAKLLYEAEVRFRAEQGKAPWKMPLWAREADSPEHHRLDWVNVSERKRCRQVRQSHELYLTLEDDGIQLTFEHGKYGYRVETHLSWACAFFRLGDIMTGRCSWHHFGSQQSQQTLLGKGQFYWLDPRTNRTVPVDNFVYVTADGHEVTLAGVSHESYLSVEGPKVVGGEERYAHERYGKHSDGLRRLAELLGGYVDLADFGTTVRPVSLAEAPRRAEQLSAAEHNWGTAGHFVVKSIYRNYDVHPAPILLFRDKEGRQVRLSMDGSVWTVETRWGRRRGRPYRFEGGGRVEALRVFAKLLSGESRFRPG